MQLLLLVLQLVQAIVDSALREKLLMRALLAQAAFVKHEDAVGVLNGAQAVRDDESGAPGEQAIQSFANEQLGLGVHARSGFVENQEARVVGKSAGKINELALADGECGAAFVDVAGDALGKGADEFAEADFVNGAFDCGAIDAGRAEPDVRFNGAGKKKGILEHDAELAAEILQVDQANVFAVEEDLAALNVVEAEQEGDEGGFAGAGVTDDSEGLPGGDAERDIAEDPIFFGGLRDVPITEPNVAEFDFAARMVERNGVGIRIDRDRLIQELEDALGGGHGGLENVELFAEVLNGAEEALSEHGEGGENAKGEAAGKDANSTGPKDQGNSGEAEEFDGRIEESVSENRVAPGEHIVAIALLKFVHGFAFAVEELHDAHAGNVFLEECIDARDGRADAAIGVAYELAENHGDDEDAGKNGESGQRQPRIDLEKQGGHDHEEEEIVDHGDDAGSEEIVEGVHVRGHAGDEAADGIAVEIAHRQTLHVGEYFAAHVVHGLLADALHDANLDVLCEEVEHQHGQ